MTVILAEFTRPENATNKMLSNNNENSQILIVFLTLFILNINTRIEHNEINSLSKVKHLPSKLKKDTLMPYNMKPSIHPGWKKGIRQNTSKHSIRLIRVPIRRLPGILIISSYPQLQQQFFKLFYRPRTIDLTFI